MAGRPKKNEAKPLEVQEPEQELKAAPVKPQIVIRAQPITAPIQTQVRQSNQVTVVEKLTGKRTQMGREAAARLVRKNPKTFEIL